MSETPEVATEQFDRNYDLLERSEFGRVLAPAYLAAVNLEPRLADINIVDLPADHEKTAFAVANWSPQSTSGKHEVHLRLTDLDLVMQRYQADLDEQPAAREAIAGLLGVESEQVTPQLTYVFSMLHEMGHITEFFDYEGRPEDFRAYVKNNRRALPLGWVTTKDILDPESKVGKKIAANKQLVFEHFGVDDLHGLVQVQSSAYRRMSHEKRADDFAAEALEVKPQIKSQLVYGDVESYRTAPQELLVA